MPPRFYAPALDLAQSAVTLSATESLHLARVLRLQPGASVDLFDGRGVMARGVVAHASSSAAVVTVHERVSTQPEVPWPLVVCASLLKGDAMDAVVRDATVLGATEIVPLTTLRTNVPVRRADSGRLHERWQRVAIAAAKQCGRASLPMLSDVKAVADVLRTPAWATWQRRMLVAPALATDGPANAMEGRGEPAAAVGHAPLVIASGPEGGWDDTEVEQALEAGWTSWSLGPCTLRAEHVTLAALAIVRYAWPRR